MHNFKNLKVWQRAMSLCKMVYQATRSFPQEERFGLTSQIKRAVVSVPSNIAEGASRTSNKDFTRFLTMAPGSLYELETQLILAKELGFLGQEPFVEITGEVNQIQKMLISFNQYIDKEATQN